MRNAVSRAWWGYGGLALCVMGLGWCGLSLLSNGPTTWTCFVAVLCLFGAWMCVLNVVDDER